MRNEAETLRRRILSDLDRHPDSHEAARVAVAVMCLYSLRSLGIVTTAEFFRDAADDIERHALMETVQ